MAVAGAEQRRGVAIVGIARHPPLGFRMADGHPFKPVARLAATRAGRTGCFRRARGISRRARAAGGIQRLGHSRRRRDQHALRLMTVAGDVLGKFDRAAAGVIWLVAARRTGALGFDFELEKIEHPGGGGPGTDQERDGCEGEQELQLGIKHHGCGLRSQSGGSHLARDFQRVRVTVISATFGDCRHVGNVPPRNATGGLFSGASRTCVRPVCRRERTRGRRAAIDNSWWSRRPR